MNVTAAAKTLEQDASTPDTAPAAAVKSEAARISRVRYVYLMHTLHHSFIQIGWALP